MLCVKGHFQQRYCNTRRRAPSGIVWTSSSQQCRKVELERRLLETALYSRPHRSDHLCLYVFGSPFDDFLNYGSIHCMIHSFGGNRYASRVGTLAYSYPNLFGDVECRIYRYLSRCAANQYEKWSRINRQYAYRRYLYKYTRQMQLDLHDLHWNDL